MTDELQVVPTEGIGVASSSSGREPQPLSYLHADWINQRIQNVYGRVLELLDRLIDRGLLSTGYPPFEQPITDDMLARMTPEEFMQLYRTLETESQKQELLGRMIALKLPPISPDAV
jgi:hypothetical protein